MKKFSFLLSLLLAFTGVTASAQDSRTWKKLSADADVANAVTDLSTLTDGGTYAFYSVGKSKYVKINNYENLHFGNTASLTASDDEAGLAVFTFHITKSGESTTYTFETGISGYYMGEPQDGATNASTTAASFVIQSTSSENKTSDAGNFCIKSTTGAASSAWFDMQDAQFCGWQGKDANCWYKIVPVTVADETMTCYKTSYTLKKGDEVLASGNDWYKNGATYNEKSFDKSAFYTITRTNESLIVSESNKTFTYVATKTGEIPFEANKWYRMQTRYNQANYRDNSYVVAGVFNGAAFVRGNGLKTMSTYGDVVNGLWRFEESGLGVKIYNLGTGKYLKYGKVSTVDNDGTVFYVTEAGLSSNVQFTLYTNGAYYGNHSSVYTEGLRNAGMSTWNASDAAKNDNGSNFTIYDVEADADFLTAAKTALTNTLTVSAADSKFIDNGVTTAYDAAKDKVASATSLEQLQAIFNEAVAATPATAVTPDETAYYRLKIADTYITSENINVGKDGKLETAYKANNNTNRVVSRSDANSALVPQIWQFVKVGNGYGLCNVNNHCRSAFFGNGNLDMPIDENYNTATITVKPVLSTATNDNSLVSLTLTGGNEVYGLRGVKEDNNNVNRFVGTNIYSANDPANIWQIEKVTTVPVAITDAKYATVAFPFATKVATDGVKAYYATAAADGEITLKEYAGGIIPANEGAVLYNEAGATTANLDIVTTESTVEGNILKPATAKRAGFTANSTYVLAKNSEGNAAFLKSELTVVPANKAYVEAESIPADNNGSNMLNFNFGQVTGINAAVSAEKTGVQYFDLQGRRVLYPVHGIFVTNTGKKVLVK